MSFELIKSTKIEKTASNYSDLEHELISLAKNGDNSAFKKLFDNNISKIFAFCLRISADEKLAEELTQDVFVKAWEKLKTFQGASKFSTWLHSIAINEFLMHKRKKANLLQRFVNMDNSVQNEIDSKISYHYDTNIDLEKAISSLPKQARLIFILHDIEKYQHNEISKIMNIKIGTSKAQLHRARKILREALSK